MLYNWYEQQTILHKHFNVWRQKEYFFVWFPTSDDKRNRNGRKDCYQTPFAAIMFHDIFEIVLLPKRKIAMGSDSLSDKFDSQKAYTHCASIESFVRQFINIQFNLLIAMYEGIYESRTNLYTTNL